MGSLQGPVICPAVRAKQAGASMLTIDGPLSKTKFMNSGFWGSQKIKGAKKNEGCQLNVGKWKKVQCGYSSSSNGNNSKAENFNDKDEDYVNSSVIEAVEVKNGPEGFLVKMRDGNHLRCTHNHPQAGRLPDYAPHPAIVLKMEDGSGIILPIIVLEMPSALLMAALRNVQIVRPTMYQVVQEMIDKMGYAVKLVRVTKRVHEAYFAQLYLTKVGNEAESVSFDLRPSDAINIAVRCKVPIQVNRHLAYNDGMKVMELGKPTPSSVSEGLLFTELDRPSGKPCIESKEFDIVQNMWMAAGEERYKDAADWKDKLSEFRSNKKWT